MLALPLLWLLMTGRKFSEYGLTTEGIRSQAEATVTCGIPFAAFALLSFFNWGRFAIALLMAAGIAALFVFALCLRKKPAPNAALAPCLLLAFGSQSVQHAAAGVIFYMFLLGPSEEVLFRGVIQSRLNNAFGRPFTFFGARWGWGAIVTCLLFGLTHVVNPYALFAGQWHPVWFAGPAMFCLALPFAFLRERTGGVLAPALLHAWPQAIVFAVRTLS
jgi:membrane protease YdiL (CAAX protease family)